MAKYVVGPDAALRLAHIQAPVAVDTGSWLQHLFAPKYSRGSTRRYSAMR